VLIREPLFFGIFYMIFLVFTGGTPSALSALCSFCHLFCPKHSADVWLTVNVRIEHVLLEEDCNSILDFSESQFDGRH